MVTIDRTALEARGKREKCARAIERALYPEFALSDDHYLTDGGSTFLYTCVNNEVVATKYYKNNEVVTTKYYKARKYGILRKDEEVPNRRRDQMGHVSFDKNVLKFVIYEGQDEGKIELLGIVLKERLEPMENELGIRVLIELH